MTHIEHEAGSQPKANLGVILLGGIAAIAVVSLVFGIGEARDAAKAIVLAMCAVVAVAVYMLPTIVAFTRKHHNRVPILALNLLLGWTFMFWAVALVWALTVVKPAGRAHA
jgi:hypothetical protein